MDFEFVFSQYNELYPIINTTKTYIVLEINGEIIKPGENKLIKLHVGALPSSTVISIKAHVFRSYKPGPTCLILAGMHGDEVNGIEIIRQTLTDETFKNLSRGTVIAIPILNVYGFINFSRETPDGKDVNRSFPGSLSGSLSSRVARMMTRHVLPLVDFGLDFHTGANNRYNFPQVRFTIGDARAEEMAKAFGAELIIEKNMIPKSFRKVAHGLDIPVLVYEGGEALRFDPNAIKIAKQGIINILKLKGMLKDRKIKKQSFKHLKKTQWIRAKKAGLFTAVVSSGQTVAENTIIGKIHDPFGRGEISIKANKAGVIIGHNNTPVIGMGDPLFHIGFKE